MKRVVLLSLILAGCGYQFSPSPYSMLQPLTVSVPVAVNQSSYGDLGPRLTREVITRLDSSPKITISEIAPATLRMAITTVEISGGSWDPNRSAYDLPTASASRVIRLTAEAVLEKAGETGTTARRQVVNSSRTFYVNTSDFYPGSGEHQTGLLEEEAFAWVLADLAQKITQGLFAEF
jgi:hypothetical protein